MYLAGSAKQVPISLVHSEIGQRTKCLFLILFFSNCLLSQIRGCTLKRKSSINWWLHERLICPWQLKMMLLWKLLLLLSFIGCLAGKIPLIPDLYVRQFLIFLLGIMLSSFIKMQHEITCMYIRVWFDNDYFLGNDQELTKCKYIWCGNDLLNSSKGRLACSCDVPHWRGHFLICKSFSRTLQCSIIYTV